MTPPGYWWGNQWGLNEDTTLFARTLKKAISIYGIPKILYCDQGKVFRSNYLLQLCARLGISLVNAEPYSPESKAKIERFNRTVQQMFYPLVKDFHVIDVEQLNHQFDTFVHLPWRFITKGPMPAWGNLH